MGSRRLSDITNPAAIRAAMQEYDDLGGDVFLKKYGFIPARIYELDVDGRRYPSKAIAGVAYAKQYPDETPLSSSEFSGGERTVRDRLDEWDEIGRDAFMTKYAAASASKFVIVRNENTYGAKAVVLAAYRRQFGTALDSGDFRGSREAIAGPLRRLGFTVVEKPDDGMLATNGAIADMWTLRPGETIKRTELHSRYGGSRQDGVSPSRKTPNVFLFSDPKSGHRHGYVDEWSPDGTFLYTGRGQRGDQEFISGNKAIRDHVEDGKSLRLFEGAGGTVRYVGEFTLDDDVPFEWVLARQTDSPERRRVIRFRLRPVRGSVTSLPNAKSGAPYRRQDESSPPAAPREPRSPDPDTFGRGHTAHKRLQNDLADRVQVAGFTPQSPAPHDPDFDLAWRNGDELTVVEVKSLTAANQVRQLRMGLGQVLDYTDVLAERGEKVRPVVYVEQQPSEPRWVALAARHGVRLAWPATAHELVDNS